MKKWSINPDFEEFSKNVMIAVAAAINNSLILPNFNGFLGNYMPAEVKREEIELIKSRENVHLLRITYYTSFHYLSKDLVFDKRNIPYVHQYSTINIEDPKVSKLLKVCQIRQIDITQNLENSSSLIISEPQNRKSDREFFSKILSYLKLGKVIVVQDKYEVSNFTSTTVRYVVINGKFNVLFAIREP